MVKAKNLARLGKFGCKRWKFIKNPVEAISGLLAYIKKSSIELQHEVGGIVCEKYDRH